MAVGDMLDFFPRRLLALIAGVLLSGCFGVTLQAEEVMYRCEDGSFTNRADAACPPYRSQGSLTVSADGFTLCGLYDEWETLRRTTSGGMVFSRSRDVARWQALSRIFLSVGTPQCDVQPTVRAAHASR